MWIDAATSRKGGSGDSHAIMRGTNFDIVRWAARLLLVVMACGIVTSCADLPPPHLPPPPHRVLGLPRPPLPPLPGTY